MKINFNQPIKNIKGEDIENLTLKTISVEALLAAFDDERSSLTGEEKVKRYHLATQIHTNDEIDITVEDISLIKKLIGKGYGALIVGQAWEVLEGKTV